MRDVRSAIEAREARTRGEPPPAKERKSKSTKETKPEDEPVQEAADDGASDA